MFCYHYTSADNYEKIKSEGLVPYWINKADLEPFFHNGIYGVWLWKNDLFGNEHLGSVLWQLMTKNSVNIVKLQVDVEETDLYKLYGVEVEIRHDGRLGKWNYHNRVPAVIMTKLIHPSQIHVVGTYNLLDALETSQLAGVV